MEELLEDAQEHLGESREYLHKLQTFVDMHPDLEYSHSENQTYMLNEEERRVRAEASIALYQKLLIDSLTTASQNLDTYEVEASDHDYMFGETKVDDDQWISRRGMRENYEDVKADIARLNHQLQKDLEIDLFHQTEVLEPVTTTPLNSLAD